MENMQLTKLIQGIITDVNETEMVIGIEIEKEIEIEIGTGTGTGTEKIEFERTTQDVVAGMRYVILSQ